MSTPAPKTRYAVATRAELPIGGRKLVKIIAFREIEIGVFNVGGTLVAYRNVCPHAGAPVCQGRIFGTTLHSAVREYVLAREGEILRCPWHGWEFDLLTGAQLVDPKMKLKSYDVASELKSLEAVTVETQEETIFVVLP